METQQKSKRADAETVRVVATPRALAAATIFNGVYMRPNIANGGQVPAASPFSGCPDIWPNNTATIANFATALAGSDSYGTDSPAVITLGTSNYIYVRACNGSSTNSTVAVTLYYAPSGMIQHPGDWQNNVIGTDQPAPSGSITNLAPGAVGVVPNTFVWQNVQPPPNGSDHYCLIAQINDANNSNPFPDVSTQLDLSALITNNLQWGWHNVQLMQPAGGLSWTYVTGLNISSNFPAGYYSLTVTPVGYVGWQIGFQCSQNDSNGNAITLLPTPITQDNVGILVPNIYLAPGYNALVTVSLYNPNNVASSPGAKAPIAASYLTKNAHEYRQAVDRGIVNWPMTAAHRKNNPGMPINAFVSLGAVTGVTNG